ncbi:MAG TPA: hypothetical protein VLX92_04610 [Kofleriaceae bacterium]|nr:hypothetical protein [Kofleriaceae bacterium]
MTARALPAAISIALVAATLSPVVRAPAHDGFPLSTYPMFALPRPTRVTIGYALGMTASGERRVLAPALVGSEEVLEAYAVIARALQRGPRAVGELCSEIAARVAQDPDERDIAIVRIVVGTHDAVAYLVDGRLGPEVERVRCPVARGGAR